MWTQSGFIEHGYGTNVIVLEVVPMSLVVNDTCIVGPSGGLYILFVDVVYM